MSNTESKSQIINPFLKAGIPTIVLSIGAYMCAKFISKRTNHNTSSLLSSQNNFQYDRFQTLNAISYDQAENTNNNGDNLEHKLLELETRVEYLQTRERDLSIQFLHYQAMKDRQLVLQETMHKMILEKVRAEFLVKEMVLVQDEINRMGGLILEVVKILEKFRVLEKENGLLVLKARKLCIRGKQRLKRIRELKLRIEGMEKEMVSNQDELQRKEEIVQELEVEVSQLKEVVDHLQREKIEMSNATKVEIGQKLYSLNPKNEIGVAIEDHEKVLKELEKLQKERETEANEATYLRWSNACLRHELLRFHERNHSENDAIKHENQEHHIECDCNINNANSHDNNKLCFGTHRSDNQHPSRRRKFIQRVKNYVEGLSIDAKEKQSEVKCFGRHSISEEGDDFYDVKPRKSTSSV